MFGLTKEESLIAKYKIDKQKDFSYRNGIFINYNEDTQKFIPYAEFMVNAWCNSDKYIAELQNRADTLTRYAKEKNLINIFITLTLPSSYHKTKTLKNGKIIKNPKFIDDCKHTPKAGTIKLSKMWKRILDLRPLKDLKRDDKAYFRATEPHKNGTPHLHISLFIPKDNVCKLLNSISNIYQLPQIEISSEYIPSDYKKFYDKTVKKVIYKKEYDNKFGVSTLIKNPTAYLMKYILKTFDDLRKDKNNISDLTLWYIYHGIGRFYTSRTLIPLYIYRKINYIEEYQDMYQATNIYKKGLFALTYRLTKDYQKEDDLMKNIQLSGISILSKNLYTNEITEKYLWQKKDFIKAEYDDILSEFIPINNDEIILSSGLVLKRGEPLEDRLDNEEFI